MASGSARTEYPRDIADCLGRAASRGVRRRSFQLAQLCARWTEIVGAEVARHCAPSALGGARGKSAGGALDIRTSSAFSPRLVMISADIVERVNRFLGGPYVAQLRIVHGFEPPQPDPAPAPPDGPLETPATLRAISDPGLRDALARLARGIAATEGAPVFDAAQGKR